MPPYRRGCYFWPARGDGNADRWQSVQASHARPFAVVLRTSRGTSASPRRAYQPKMRGSVKRATMWMVPTRSNQMRRKSMQGTLLFALGILGAIVVRSDRLYLGGRWGSGSPADWRTLALPGRQISAVTPLSGTGLLACRLPPHRSYAPPFWGAPSWLFQYCAHHQRYGNNRQDGVFHLRCEWRGHVFRDRVTVMKILNQFPDLHSLQVVLKRLATVEADNIRLAVLFAHVGNRGHRARKAAMGTTKQ